MPLSLASLVDDAPTLRTHRAVRSPIETACAQHPDVATFHELGPSEDGTALYGAVMGTGPITVSLIAGNHADEPVGPETLRSLLVNGLAQRNEMEPLLRRFQFVVVPHTNPDGEARNRAWMEAWPDLEAYLREAVREPPGRDMEYGFPDMRPENTHVSAFLREHGPFDLHVSLHGMSAGEGVMLLINRPWTFRTQALRDDFAAAAAAEGLPLHDHNRKGEKGFFWIEPGFQTTPRGDAMRTYFRAQGDSAMADRFHDSSMEFVASLGGDPLSLVTEVPLFLISGEGGDGHRPTRYLELRKRLPDVKARLDRGEDVDEVLAPFDIHPVPLDTAMHLQFRALELGLRAVAPKSAS
ncbi:M14 family zinc carboxypeptidase [Salinibacter altiplanensis]|uniref:M14 family zinc carboxypeptidase n=1 Tax=Salinibacter altiplanensis TaxID=1803181 RepID=UPI000C9FA331|nr:M14 family zinc carboxypeptidase [Salinibacter altiplanensis]